ncbi:MAG TPA: hypothetical protein VN903_35885 [Polyangia bacterium]|jgi:hypothetical protein|nr:hypothetical protein [Polyangia bacterium]
MLFRAMKIRYSTGLAVLMLVGATFVLGTSYITGLSLNTLTGVLILIVGIGYLTRPLAELTDSELTLFALFGPVKKQYPVASLRLVEGKIYSGEKRVRLPAWCTNSEDWRALMQRLQARSN